MSRDVVVVVYAGRAGCCASSAFNSRKVRISAPSARAVCSSSRGRCGEAASLVSVASIAGSTRATALSAAARARRRVSRDLRPLHGVRHAARSPSLPPRSRGEGRFRLGREPKSGGGLDLARVGTSTPPTPLAGLGDALGARRRTRAPPAPAVPLRDRRAPRRPVPAPPAVAQRCVADAALGADVGDRPLGVLVFVADLRPGFGAEFGHGGSLSLRDCPDLRSSAQRKRVRPRARGSEPEALDPACAGMSGDSCAREIVPTSRSAKAGTPGRRTADLIVEDALLLAEERCAVKEYVPGRQDPPPGPLSARRKARRRTPSFMNGCSG